MHVAAPAPFSTKPASKAPTVAGRFGSGPERRLRVLVFSSLFPSEARPRHGIFVETRLAQLIRDHPVDARVIAPVPWFPWKSASFGSYAAFAATPQESVRPNGIAVAYPRYLMIPRIGVPGQPDRMAEAGWLAVKKLVRKGWRPDIIDAHYLYPDCVAAAEIARRLGIPVVMTARGTDVNVLARMPGPGARIVQAVQAASSVIAVATPLKEALAGIGIDKGKISVLRNGVDMDVFAPTDRSKARARFGLPARGVVLTSVGNLVAEKGQLLAVETLKHLPGAHLVLVGEGPMHRALKDAATRLDVIDRVSFIPSIPQHDLRFIYAAADVLLLTSTREGWPNVVLEALACGTPVVATDVGAVSEMIDSDLVGRIVAERNPSAMAGAVRQLLSAATPREDLRAHAARFDWASVSSAQWKVFMSSLELHANTAVRRSPLDERLGSQAQ